MIRASPGLEAGSDVDEQIAALHELNTTLTMASGHPSQLRLGPTLPFLVGLVSSPITEVALLSVRALNTTLDISPRIAASLNAAGALSPLTERLLEITDMDLAEQCLKCLHLIAREAPRAVLDAGGIKACIMFFDFFPVSGLMVPSLQPLCSERRTDTFRPFSYLFSMTFRAWLSRQLQSCALLM
jgi:hypothetical protein